MHYIKDVRYEGEYVLRLVFEDGSVRLADLKDKLGRGVFAPLKDPARFRTARLNMDIDTVVWDNGADMSPDYLYEISVPIGDTTLPRVAERQTRYGQ